MSKTSKTELWLKFLSQPLIIVIILGLLLWLGIGNIEGVDAYFTLIIDKLKELRQ